MTIKYPCEENPDLFFPSYEIHKGRISNVAQKAIDICMECPYRAACLNAALEYGNPPVVGVWGATVTEQRRRLLRLKQRPN